MLLRRIIEAMGALVERRELEEAEAFLAAHPVDEARQAISQTLGGSGRTSPAGADAGRDRAMARGALIAALDIRDRPQTSTSVTHVDWLFLRPEARCFDLGRRFRVRRVSPPRGRPRSPDAPWLFLFLDLPFGAAVGYAMIAMPSGCATAAFRSTRSARSRGGVRATRLQDPVDPGARHRVPEARLVPAMTAATAALLVAASLVPDPPGTWAVHDARHARAGDRDDRPRREQRAHGDHHPLRGQGQGGRVLDGLERRRDRAPRRAGAVGVRARLAAGRRDGAGGRGGGERGAGAPDRRAAPRGRGGGAGGSVAARSGCTCGRC
jgi:hypothetical protein